MVNNKVHEKGYCNMPLKDMQKELTKEKSKIRARRIEPAFGAMKQSMSRLFVHSIGEKRTTGFEYLV